MRHLRTVTSQRPYGGNIIAEAMLNFKMIQIARTTKTLTDFLAKARLLDRDVNLMCQFNCIMAAFINKSSERCVLLVFGLFR